MLSSLWPWPMAWVVVMMVAWVGWYFFYYRPRSPAYRFSNRTGIGADEFIQKYYSQCSQYSNLILDLRNDLAKCSGVHPTRIFPSDRLFVDLISGSKLGDMQRDAFEDMIYHRCEEAEISATDPSVVQIQTVDDYIRTFLKLLKDKRQSRGSIGDSMKC